MNPPPVPVIVVLDPSALELARKIASGVPSSTIHGLSSRAHGCVDEAFDETALHLRLLFDGGHPIIGICAAGILIRCLAPVLGSKRDEPPVIAVASDGSAVVPLLGGHHGANGLADSIADGIGVPAAKTTASDLRLGFSFDDPPIGWVLETPGAVKSATARVLAGSGIAVDDACFGSPWPPPQGEPGTAGQAVNVLVSEKIAAENRYDLVYRPKCLVLGVGCERHCEPTELQDLVLDTLSREQLSSNAISCVASIDLKADEAAVHALASQLGVPARFFSPQALERERPRLQNPSRIVFLETGCHGVAEGAALAGAGSKGSLVVPKAKSAHATCAVARAPEVVDPCRLGRPRGRLAVVGIGPGQAAWRTPEACRQLANATDVVGYRLYLDLIDDLIVGKARHHSDLSEEEARVRKALDLAAVGGTVALVCSGDAGIYALATLVFELLDREDRPDWNRIDVSVSPGISAIQAAAARIGAPIGHDFCTISLSDLLTPWPLIERRLSGAAHGDFVVALYNPVSRRRRYQIEAARDILLTGRPPETPVVLARNLGRTGEEICVVELGALTPDSADMLTLVLIGNSQSRLVRRGERSWVYTPRGYADKFAGEIRA